MKLKGNYNIDESGHYTVIFKDDNGEEWEVEFEIWIGKEYHYEETGKFLRDVYIQSKCLSPGFRIREELDMEIELEEDLEELGINPTPKRVADINRHYTVMIERVIRYLEKQAKPIYLKDIKN